MVTKLERENNTIFYLHNAWANSPDGTAGFTLEESEDAAYIGNCISMSSAEVLNPSSYNWIAVEFEAVEESDTAELTELGEDVPEDPEDEDEDYSYEDYMDGAVQSAADTATTAQESADIAQQKAEEATASAALAQQKAEEATASAALAQQKAEAAATSATEAKTAAAAATADATTAKAQAAEAKTAADAATKDAGTAKEKAEVATTAAATAQQKAESATAAAGTAQSAAQSATSDARAAGIAAATAQAAAEAAQGDIDEQQKYFYHDAIGAHVLDAVNGNFRTDIKSTGMYVVDTATETPLTEITDDSLIFGVGNVCNGSNNIALGRENESEAGCQFSYLEGNRCKIGNYGTNTSISSHAEGHSTIYGARFSHTEGEATITATDEKPLVMYSHAEGTAQIKGASWCHAEGDSIATGDVYHGHLEGESKITDSLSSHSEGRSILVNCDRSHAEGMAKIEYGSIDHAEGKAIITRTKAADGEVPSHAEGTSKIEESWISHAEGSSTITGAKYAHAEGSSTITGAKYAHAEGNVTEATGEASHVEGYLSKANGKASHAEGTSTIASGENSHASGEGTEAVGACQTVLGKYNTADAEKALIVGNGDLLNKSNALTLDWDGNLKAAGDVTCDAAVGTASLSALNDTVAALSMVIDKVWIKIYPVGSIYISTSAESPADLFGGTWEKIEDRFLLASGDQYALGTTGGTADAVVVNHTHTQAAHSHGFTDGGKVWTTETGSTEPGAQISGTAKYYAATAKKDYAWRTSTASATPAINNSGEDGTGKNLPPYLSVNVWKRVK